MIPYLPRIKSFEVAKAIFGNVVFHRWNEATFSEVVTKSDVAIIPIATGDPFTRGKPGNKLALLWRMAMPVVTSATPAYRRMQDAAELGYLACDDSSIGSRPLTAYCPMKRRDATLENVDTLM